MKIIKFIVLASIFNFANAAVPDIDVTGIRLNMDYANSKKSILKSLPGCILTESSTKNHTRNRGIYDEHSLSCLLRNEKREDGVVVKFFGNTMVAVYKFTNIYSNPKPTVDEILLAATNKYGQFSKTKERVSGEVFFIRYDAQGKPFTQSNSYSNDNLDFNPYGTCFIPKAIGHCSGMKAHIDGTPITTKTAAALNLSMISHGSYVISLINFDSIIRQEEKADNEKKLNDAALKEKEYSNREKVKF